MEKSIQSLGGTARAKALSPRKRREIAAKAGIAAQAKLTTKERKRRAALAWITRRKNNSKIISA
jgi:hypothetical protein